jgi:hypothetical protein
MIDMFKKLIGWDSVGTILKARLEMIAGMVMAGVTSMAAFNFIPYLTGTVDKWMLGTLAAYAFLTGVVGEITRRYNATDV